MLMEDNIIRSLECFIKQCNGTTEELLGIMSQCENDFEFLKKIDWCRGV